MSKTKYANAEEAKAAVGTTREVLEAKKAEMEKFLETNKLKRKHDYSADKTHGKAFKALAKAVTDARAEWEGAKAATKELKVKEPRAYKYEYPADVQGDAVKMKKFRTAQRALAKKAAKGAAGEGKPKKKKAEIATTEASAPVKNKKKVAPATPATPATD